ncbi:aldo/keto reductase [Thermodesulfobacteriota bacterium]
MKLALGTVQFGLDYGIAGRGEVVPEKEVCAILDYAFSVGIDTLDTAAVYGTIETRLGELLRQRWGVRIVSKLPPVPQGLSSADAPAWAGAAFSKAQTSLRDSLAGYLFHRAEDLLGVNGKIIWETLQPLCERAGVALGVSCYGPDELDLVRSKFPVALAQLPGNAMDQRYAHSRCDGEDLCEIYLRSAFLQGLLLMPYAKAIKRLPSAEPALRLWHEWCAQRGWTPLFAALAVVKGFRSARYCVVGVDSLKQLEEIVLLWEKVEPVVASHLSCALPEVIDPRCWRVGRE